jgi:hypothetical protein
MTTTPLIPKGLNLWKWLSMTVAFASFAAVTRISSSIFWSFKSLTLQFFNSNSKCDPKACKRGIPFHS